MRDPGLAKLAKILAAQYVACLLLAALFLPLGVEAFVSALCGGAIAAVPNTLFARGVFAKYRAAEPERLLGGIYAAQIKKLLLTGALFAAVFHWMHPLNEGALFGAFVAVYLLPLLIAHKLG